MIKKTTKSSRFLIIVVSFAFIMVKCTSNKNVINYDNNVTEVLHDIIKEANKKTYYKTIIKDSGEPISSYVNNEYLEFYLCVSEIDSAIIIPKNEVVYLNQKFRQLTVARIDKILPKLNQNITRKKNELETSYISIPIFFRNNTMAIYYFRERYGAGFNLLQKKNEKWKKICSRTVWIE